MVYFGRLLSQKSYDNLIMSPYFEMSWVKNLKDTRGRYILAPPDCIITIGGMDPIISDYEIKQGFVKWLDIVKHSSYNKELTDKLQKMEEVIDTLNTHFKLKKLISIVIKESNEKDVFYGKYIIEMSGSSLDDFNTWSVSKNLRII